MNIHRLYRPFQRHFRERRMASFSRLFQVDETTRILDLGGTAFNWSLIASRPRVTLLNLEGGSAKPDGHREGNLTYRTFNGRRVPFEDDAFDICYSNSVIEHVGGPDAIELFAAEIRRLAPRYYVQTPNRNFPIEPHLVAPVVHWVPRSVARKIVRPLTPWGWINRPSQPEVDRFLDSIHLLGGDEMKSLFPDAEITFETFARLHKSIIAQRL